MFDTIKYGPGQTQFMNATSQFHDQFSCGKWNEKREMNGRTEKNEKDQNCGK